MFKRLLKHEFKSTIKEFLIILSFSLIASFLIGISVRLKSMILLNISIVSFYFSYLALCGLSIYYFFKISRKNAHGRQGYLLFSLPVNSHQLVLSKIIVIFTYMIMIIVSAFLSIVILLLFLTPIEINDIFLNVFSSIVDKPIYILFRIIWSSLSSLAAIVFIQFIDTFTNSCYVTKNKGSLPIKFGFLFFGVGMIGWVLLKSIINKDIFIIVEKSSVKFEVIEMMDNYGLLLENTSTMFSVTNLIVSIVCIIVFYLLTIKLMNKKLEL